MKGLKAPLTAVAVLTIMSLPTFAKSAAELQAEANKEAAKAQAEQNAAGSKAAKEAAEGQAEAAKEETKALELQNKRKFK